MKQIISTLYILFFAFAGHLAAQGSRIMLTQLERGPLIDGSRQGLIGLTNANGDQRYAFYVNVADTCVLTTPTDTGNAVVSIFVQKCATDSIWYIDWEGRSILLAPYGGAGSCDVDWLEISDNSCPDAITDSLYKYKYASIGARYVWPGSELLVNDSASAALVVIQGSRNARLAAYDKVNETFTMLDHGGSTPYFYFPPDGEFVFSTVTGTPQSPTAGVSHFSINASDSTIQMHQYPDTRRDTNSVLNFLYTDDIGKIRSQSIDSFPGGENIYTTSGTITDSTDRLVIVDTAALLHFAYDSLSDGGIKVFGPNDDGFGVSISSANELHYTTISDNEFVAGGAESSFGDFNETNNGLGVNFLADEFTIGDIFSNNNFGFYGGTLNRTVQMFSQNYGGGAEFLTQGKVTVDSSKSIISFYYETLPSENELGFNWNFGPGLWAQINGTAASPGDILRTADDGLMYFYQLDTVGVNIYNSNGSIPSNETRDVIIEESSTLSFRYTDGFSNVGFEMYAGSVDDSYVGIESASGGRSVYLRDDGTGLIIRSDDKTTIGDVGNASNGVGIDIADTYLSLGNVFGANDRYITYDASAEGVFSVQNESSYIDMDVSGNVTIGYGSGDGTGSLLFLTENGAANANISQSMTSLEISADDGNDLGYSLDAEVSIGRIGISGRTPANATSAVVATADDTGNGKSSSVVLSISDPDAVALNSAAIEIDTNGVKIQTTGGTGANGNVIKSNGLYTYWADASDIEWDSVGGFFSAHDQDGQREIRQSAGEFFAYGGNGQYYYQFYGEEDSGRSQIESGENGTGKLAIVSTTAEDVGSASSLIRAFIIDSISVDVRQEITIDTNGIAILTQGSDGSAGDILQSDGSHSRWGGAGAFNADVLSFTPGGSASAWVAIPANRATLAGFATVASISPSESVTEILIDTASITSTVNLNYTPDARLDNPFTTVRYIYNWGSGNATVQTNQSWLFKTNATTSGTLTIASGESYKLIWLSNATAANARFYCVKLQ
jgi:hypothetical protein